MNEGSNIIERSYKKKSKELLEKEIVHYLSDENIKDNTSVKRQLEIIDILKVMVETNLSAGNEKRALKFLIALNRCIKIFKKNIVFDDFEINSYQFTLKGYKDSFTLIQNKGFEFNIVDGKIVSCTNNNKGLQHIYEREAELWG
jgi:hypothetical protein